MADTKAKKPRAKAEAAKAPKAAEGLAEALAIAKAPVKKTGRPRIHPPKDPTAEKRPRGRPHKLNSDDIVIMAKLDICAKVQCTTREAAAHLDVCHDTFLDFVDRDLKAKEVWKSGPESGKCSLRVAQFKSAMKGNTSMQIWLGKQWLGQRDKNDVEHSGKLTLAELVLGSYRTEAQAAQDFAPGEKLARA